MPGWVTLESSSGVEEVCWRFLRMDTSLRRSTGRPVHVGDFHVGRMSSINILELWVIGLSLIDVVSSDPVSVRPWGWCRSIIVEEPEVRSNPVLGRTL